MNEEERDRMGDRDWFLSIENLLHNWTDIVKGIGHVLTIGLGIVGLLEYLILTYFILAVLYLDKNR